jgi:hypothetical protein
MYDFFCSAGSGEPKGAKYDIARIAGKGGADHRAEITDGGSAGKRR